MKSSRAMMAVLSGAGAVAAAAAGCNADPRCGSDTIEVDGACVARNGLCPRGTVELDGDCVPDGSVVCGTGTTFNTETGVCDPDITGCAEGTVLVEGECVPEDEVRTGDVLEGPEPNDGLPDGFAFFDLPAVGEDILLQGCIEPYRDLGRDGEQDPDFDAFLFEATGPALLDITVDGVGGAAGGFRMVAAGGDLAQDDWVRFGINLSNDTIRQQAFLPAAGTYALLVTDSRSVLTGLAAGGPGACYFATIANIAIPAPTPLDGAGVGPLGGAVQFWSYAPEVDGEVIHNAVNYTSKRAAAGLVQMVNDEYRGSTPFVDFGISAGTDLASLTTGDRVVLVVEPLANFAIGPVETTLTVTPIPATRIVTDGSPTTLVHEDASPLDFVFFQASAGDVVRLQFDPGAVPYDITLYPPRTTNFDFFADQWISNVCSDFDCEGGVDSWIQLRESGYYYLTIANGEADDGEAYQVGFTITPDRPAPLGAGTPAAGLLAGGRDFFEATIADSTWLDFAVEATAFASARLRFYDRTAAGELDELVLPLDEGISSDGEPFGRIVAEREGAFLISVENADGSGGGETFDLLMAQKPFIDAGVVIDGSPVELNDIALAAGQPTFVFLRGGDGDSVRVRARDDSGRIDLVLEQLDRTETVLFTRNRGGDGAEESLARVLDEDPFIALRVSAAGAGPGSFDLDAAVVDLAESAGARAPALPIPDGDPDGAMDVLVLSDPCSVAVVTVDVNITHPFRSDIRLTLTSPSGTSVRLKGTAGEAGANLIGTFPITLEPSDSLDAYLGEDGTGNWILNAADVEAQDVGRLNAWGVNLLCM